MLMAFDPTILYLKMYSEEYLEMCAEIHTQGVNNWKWTKCPQTRECLNTVIHSMEYHVIPTNATIEVNL